MPEKEGSALVRPSLEPRHLDDSGSRFARQRMLVMWSRLRVASSQRTSTRETSTVDLAASCGSSVERRRAGAAPGPEVHNPGPAQLTRHATSRDQHGRQMRRFSVV